MKKYTIALDHLRGLVKDGIHIFSSCRFEAKLHCTGYCLPPIPGNKITAKARPQARTLDLEILPDTESTASEEETQLDQLDAGSGDDDQNSVSATDVETLARIQDLEIRFRKGFQDALTRASRKPSTFGGSIGHAQLSGLVGALQRELPEDDSSCLHTLKGVGMRWSEDGFDHLLYLRLDWVNDRFDDLFGLTVPATL